MKRPLFFAELVGGLLVWIFLMGVALGAIVFTLGFLLALAL